MGGGGSKPADPPPPTDLSTSGSPSEIVCYKDADFGGESVTYVQGVGDVAYADQFSSFRVTKGYWVAYEHPNYTGKRFLLHWQGGPKNDGRYNFGAKPAKGTFYFTDDCISSLQPVAPNLIQMFLGAYDSEYDLHASSGRAVHDNTCTAVKVHGGAWRAHENSNKTGAHWDFHLKGGSDYGQYLAATDFKNDVISYVEFLGEHYFAHYTEENFKGKCTIYQKSCGKFAPPKSFIIGGGADWTGTNKGGGTLYFSKDGGPGGDGFYPNVQSMGGEVFSAAIFHRDTNQNSIIFYEGPNYTGPSRTIHNSWNSKDVYYGAKIHLYSDGMYVNDSAAFYTVDDDKHFAVSVGNEATTTWTIRQRSSDGESTNRWYWPVKHGDIITLQADKNELVAAFLHVSKGKISPATSAQMVSGYPWFDADDDWIVRIEEGGNWSYDKNVSLQHRTTGKYLDFTGEGFTAILRKNKSPEEMHAWHMQQLALQRSGRQPRKTPQEEYEEYMEATALVQEQNPGMNRFHPNFRRLVEEAKAKIALEKGSNPFTLVDVHLKEVFAGNVARKWRCKRLPDPGWKEDRSFSSARVIRGSWIVYDKANKLGPFTTLCDDAGTEKRLRPNVITYGSVLRLKHNKERKYLTACDIKYDHSPQGVNRIYCHSVKDDNSLWVIVSGTDYPEFTGKPVCGGDVIRLRNKATGQYLCCLSNIEKSPQSRQPYAHGLNPTDNDFCDLRVDLSTSSKFQSWKTGVKLRFVHQKLQHTLHSHRHELHSKNRAVTVRDSKGKNVTVKEVTFFSNRDHNDEWIAEDLKIQAGPVGCGEYKKLPATVDDKISAIEAINRPLIEFYAESGLTGATDKHTDGSSHLNLETQKSIIVRKGTWAAYTETYGGEAYLFHRYGGPAQDGRYYSASDWGSQIHFKSVALLTWDYPLIELYSQPLYKGRKWEIISSHEIFMRDISVGSIRVIRGSWIMYTASKFKGHRILVDSAGGPDGDGSYPNHEAFAGEAKIAIHSIELPDDSFYAAVVHNSTIHLHQLDRGTSMGTYQVQATRNNKPFDFYLSNGIIGGNLISLKKDSKYFTWTGTPGANFCKVELSNRSSGDWVVNIRDRGLWTSDARFTLSPRGHQDLFLAYNVNGIPCLRPKGEDEYEYDFRAANFVADDIDVSVRGMVGPSNAAATYFDDGPVLREEVLVEIRASKSFNAYQLGYFYVDGNGKRRKVLSEKRGNTREKLDQVVRIDSTATTTITIWHDSYAIKGIEIRSGSGFLSSAVGTLGTKTGTASRINMGGGYEFCGFSGYQTDTQLTKLGVQYRRIYGKGWLGRYFSDEGCIGEMSIGVYYTQSPPPYAFKSMHVTGCFCSKEEQPKPTFQITYPTKKSLLKVDGQVVMQDGKQTSHTIKLYEGSVHSFEGFLDFSERKRHTGHIKVSGGMLENRYVFPGMTDRDLLRSYLRRMPPTNPFGRAFIAVLLNEDDFSPETLACQEAFSTNKKLIQILTTNWKDTEKEAKKYLFDNVLAAIDDDLQEEAFGAAVVEKKHYVIADDVRLDKVLASKEYKDLALAYLGIMAFQSDEERFKMIEKDKINKAIEEILASEWGQTETKQLGDMLRAKFQPQLAFGKITGEEFSRYIPDIGKVVNSPVFKKTFMKMTDKDQVEAAQSVIAVFTALDPDPEKWEPYLRTLMELVSTSQTLSTCDPIMEALKKNEKAFHQQIKQAIGGLSDDDKKIISSVGLVYGAAGGGFSGAADIFIERSMGMLKSNPGKYLGKRGLNYMIDDIESAVAKAEKKLAGRAKAAGVFAKFASVAAIVGVAFSADFSTPVSSASFGLTLAQSIVDAKDAFVSAAQFLDDLLVPVSKIMRNIHSKILTPLKSVVSKVGAKIAAKATAISTNFGKLGAQLGKYAGKVLGPALGVITSCFSFYYAWSSFESGQIVDGCINVVSGVIGVVGGILGAINACTGAFPVANAVVAVISLLVLVGAILWSFFKPKRKNKLVAALKARGWANAHLRE